MTNVAPRARDARPYSSPVREERARATRRLILAAARDLFLEQGYAAASLAQVAATAGVSADTAYKVFGSKIGLLKELLDVVVGGDDAPVALLDRPGPRQLQAEQDLRVQVRLLAQGVTRQLEAVRPVDDILRSAAAVDPEAAALRRDIQDRQRHAAMRAIASWLAQPELLRPEGRRGERADTIWALTSPELHELLRTRRRWSAARYADWLESMLLAALVD